MKEATATRLTTAGGGIDGGTLGAVGGVQNVTLAANQIPTITATNASQAISVNPSSGFVAVTTGTITDSSLVTGSSHVASSNGTWAGTNLFSGSNSISATYTNSSQSVTKTVMPAIIVNKILRVI
jgi:hypothetical protein